MGGLGLQALFQTASAYMVWYNSRIDEILGCFRKLKKFPIILSPTGKYIYEGYTEIGHNQRFTDRP